MKYFTNHNVIAFTSDVTLDFTPTDFYEPLTSIQQQYLKQHTGCDIERVVWRQQVHGDEIVVVDDLLSDHQFPQADAFVTKKINTPLAIRTADCVPVFLYDPVEKVIGIVHAGWQGTLKNITRKTVEMLKSKFGCQANNILAALGPSGGTCCYEVGVEFKEYFPQDIIERQGKLYADIANNNVRQLMTAGIPMSNITSSDICTMCCPDYFSFRREGAKAGRMISLITRT